MADDAATLAAYATRAAAFADAWLDESPPADLQAAARAHFRCGANGGVTADIGCGSGRDVDWLHRHGYPCVGFDANEAMRAEAGRRFPGLRFERSALPALAEIAERTFDNVVCATVLMHLPRDAVAPAIEGLRRILVADGVLYVSWRSVDADCRDAHGRLYTAFDPSLVRDALDGMTILHDGAVAGSAGRRFHALVARANGNRANRKPKDGRRRP